MSIASEAAAGLDETLSTISITNQQRQPLLPADGVVVVFPQRRDNGLLRGLRDEEQTHTLTSTKTSSQQIPLLSQTEDHMESNSPFSITIVNYTVFLSILLVIFVFYLCLPKGLRVYFCHAYPKRVRRLNSSVITSTRSIYSTSKRSTRASLFNVPPEVQAALSGEKHVIGKRTDSGVASARKGLIHVGSSDTTTDTNNSDPNKSNLARRLLEERIESGIRASRALVDSSDSNTTTTSTSYDKAYMTQSIPTATPQRNMSMNNAVTSNASTTSPTSTDMFTDLLLDEDPSPYHPDPHCNHKAPNGKSISSTMASLRSAQGIRLYAHGTQCDKRRIWLCLNIHMECLVWRAEISSAGHVSSVSPSYRQMGQDHEIPLRDILYIDVGKTTPALRQLDEEEVSDSNCFSILTRIGTLDLNTGNQMERDAIISSFCLILDTVHLSYAHDGRDHWRNMYHQKKLGSPGRSTTISNTASQHQTSSVASNRSSDVFSSLGVI